MRLFPRPEYPPRAVLEDTALTSPFPKVRKVALLELRIDLRPNCSLTPAAARVFFASICTFSFSVALFFTLQGFWPVLLCWALEMLALGFALYSVMQRRFYTQTVLVTESRISLVTRSPAGEAKQEFARHWAKVKLRSPRASRHPSRLMIESHGRAFEVLAAARSATDREASAAVAGSAAIGRPNRSIF